MLSHPRELLIVAMYPAEETVGAGVNVCRLRYRQRTIDRSYLHAVPVALRYRRCSPVGSLSYRCGRA